MVRQTSRTGILTVGLFLVLLNGGPVFALDSVICKWHGDASGAYSMTFDDGAVGQGEYAVPLLDAHELKATFFVIGSTIHAWYIGSVRIHMREIVQMAREGHEIGSHTYNHRDLRTLTDSEIRQEIEQCQEYLGRYGLRPTSMSYPYSGCDERVEAIVADYFEFARCGYPMVTNSSEWQAINPLHLYWSDSADHYSCLDGAIEQGQWAIGVFHEIGYNGPTVSEFSQFVDTLAYLRDSNALWVDTMTNVGRYIRERAFAHLTTKTREDGHVVEVTLSVADECPSPLVPLTVKTNILMYMVSITQAGNPVDFTISEAEGQRFALYDMLPNTGPVRISLTGKIIE